MASAAAARAGVDGRTREARLCRRRARYERVARPGKGSLLEHQLSLLYMASFLSNSTSCVDCCSLAVVFQKYPTILISGSAIWLFRRRFRNTLPRTEAAPSRRLTEIQIQCDSCLSCTVGKGRIRHCALRSKRRRETPPPFTPAKGAQPPPPPAPAARALATSLGLVAFRIRLGARSECPPGPRAPRPARDRGEAGRRSRIRPAAGRCMTFRGAATCQRRRWRRPWPRPRQPGRRAGHRGPTRQGRTRRARRSRRRAARRA